MDMNSDASPPCSEPFVSLHAFLPDNCLQGGRRGGCGMQTGPQHLEGEWLQAQLQRQLRWGSRWALRLCARTRLLCSPLPPVLVGATGSFPEKGSLPFLVPRSAQPCSLKVQFCLLVSPESLCSNCWPKQLMNESNDKFPLALHYASGLTHLSVQSHPKPWVSPMCS